MSESKKSAKNPNVGKFEIIAPDGNFFIIDSGIPYFLECHPEYKIDKNFLYYTKRVGEYKGWKVNKI